MSEPRAYRDLQDEIATLRQELEQLRTETALIRLVAIKARAWVHADRSGRPQGPSTRGDKRKTARVELKAAVDAWKAAGHG